MIPENRIPTHPGIILNEEFLESFTFAVSRHNLTVQSSLIVKGALYLCSLKFSSFSSPGFCLTVLHEVSHLASRTSLPITSA